jgi:Mn-dependent DtxR family transcriptional regulator
MGIIWSMIQKGQPVTPTSLARQMSFTRLSVTDALAGLNELAADGLMVERDGGWTFTDAGWKRMD